MVPEVTDTDVLMILQTKAPTEQHVLMLLQCKVTQHPTPSLIDAQMVPEVTDMVPGSHLSM